jgi:RNA polymerase sigma-70 factor (ECF subfamily)
LTDDSNESLATRGKEPQAFAELYERLRLPAYRLARRYVNDDEAIDIVAASFERAFARIATFDPARGTFAAWFLRLTHNAAMDAARRTQRQSRLHALARLGRSREVADPEALAIAGEEFAELRDALARLTAPEREALALRYGESLSAREIATVLGKTTSGTEKMIARAMAKLRKEMS